MAQKKICDICKKDITGLRECDLAPTRAYVKIGVPDHSKPEVSIHIADDYDFCEKCRMEVEILGAHALLKRTQELLTLRGEW